MVACTGCGRFSKGETCGRISCRPLQSRCSRCGGYLEGTRALTTECTECDRRSTLPLSGLSGSSPFRLRSDERECNAHIKRQRDGDDVPSRITSRHHSISVMEIGCGAGHFACQFLNAGLSVLGGADTDERMLKQFRIQCPEAETLDLEFSTVNVDDYADWIEGVVRARSRYSRHVHLNMTLSCEWISDACVYFVPEFVEQDAIAMAQLVNTLRRRGLNVTWVSENVNKPAYIQAMLMAFGDECQWMVLSSYECSSEMRTRAFFCTKNFDLTRFAETSAQPHARVFVADVFPEADLIGSGSRGSNATRKWTPASGPLPTFTSNGLYYLPAHCTRATRGKMVPLWVVALCRGLVVPEGPGIGVVAQRIGLARAISGWIGKEFARQLCA